MIDWSINKKKECWFLLYLCKSEDGSVILNPFKSTHWKYLQARSFNFFQMKYRMLIYWFVEKYLRFQNENINFSSSFKSRSRGKICYEHLLSNILLVTCQQEVDLESRCCVRFCHVLGLRLLIIIFFTHTRLILFQNISQLICL